VKSIHKKNICIITTVHSGSDARIFIRQAKSLQKEKYSVKIIAPYIPGEKLDNVSFTAVKPIRIKWLRIVTNIKILVLAKNTHADIYHFHDPDFLLFGCLLKGITGKPVIFDVHEDFSKVLLSARWLPKIFRKLSSKIYTLVENYITMYLDGIITATEHIASKFKPGRAVVIHNYPRRISFPLNPSIKKHPFSIVFIGGLTEVRGITQMLDGLKLLRKNAPVTIDIFGNFTDPLYERHIKSIYNESWIIFHGFVPNDKVYQKIAKAEIGIIPYLPIPNHLESLPTKMFEYMMLGLPIACSNFQLWKDIIVNNGCGKVFEPSDPNEISDVLFSMLSERKELELMKKSCQNIYERNFSWETEEKRFLALYESLLK